MCEKAIPYDVEQFFLKYVDSIAEWEGLLLLRAHPAEEWDAEKAARKLYVAEEEAAALLARLAEKGFLGSVGAAYRYEVKPPDLERDVSAAAELYKRRLIPITDLIHSKTKNRFQAFADAFRLRKDD